jgi:pyrroline-5-carboxylate reductase
MSLEQPRIGFIGAGRMATALAKGWLSAGLISAHNCRASDPVPDIRNAFSAATGIATSADNREAATSCNVILLAVKPQDMNAVLAELRGIVTKEHLIISIAAGFPISGLSQGLGQGLRLIRVMPNTPALIQCCAGGYAAGSGATSGDVAFVDRLMNVVGRAFDVPEELLDAVTGLSGSGPAYVYTIIEALSDGGVLMGLPRHVATSLAAQTVFGAAKMVLDSGSHPAVLKDQVTSPGGTTIAGLQALEKCGLRSSLIEAVAAATRRSQELGKV